LCAVRRRQLRLRGISHTFEVVSRQPKLPRQSDRREPLPGGDVGGEVQPKPTRSGTRSRHEGGSRPSSPKSGVSGGKPKGATAYPTDRVLGGGEPGHRSPRSSKRANGEAWSNASRCPVETLGARGARFGAESRFVGSLVETPGVRARLRRKREDLAVLALTVRSLPRLLVDIFHSPFDPARLSPTRAGRAGCLVHRGARIPVCFDVRQVGRLPDSELAKETSRGFSSSRWQHR
jgi:hypothetical protein